MVTRASCASLNSLFQLSDRAISRTVAINNPKAIRVIMKLLIESISPTSFNPDGSIRDEINFKEKIVKTCAAPVNKATCVNRFNIC